MKPTPIQGSSIKLKDGATGKVIRSFVRKGVSASPDVTVFVIGVYRTPVEFAAAASEWRHPVDMCTSTPDVTKRNLFWMLTSSPKTVAEFRLLQLQKLRSMVPKFEELDNKLKERCSPQMLCVLKGKRLELLREILVQADYPDLQIVSDIANGLPVVGPMPGSGVFPEKVRAASITPQQLRSSSKWTRAAILSKVRASKDPAVDQAVWDESLKEEANGWTSGPFSEEQITAQLGELWIASRRFGLKQGTKVRAIDDYTESQANSTVSMFEKLELMGVDDLVAVVKIAAESVSPTGQVCVELDSGEQLRGDLPEGVSVAQARSWAGKTVDLKAAYRQLPTRPSEAWASVIAVYNPLQKNTGLFIQHALPFGAVGSVSGFDREARALWAAVSFWLRLSWTNFYDDYPTVELEANATQADIAIRAMLMILGWTMTTDPSKCKAFEKVFDVLGVSVDLSLVPAGKVVVRNKVTRVETICEQIAGVEAEGFMSAPLAAEVRGKCQFAANQLFGRVAAGPLSVLSEHQHKAKSKVLSLQVKEALARLKSLLKAGKPRELRFLGETRPVLVFSDGACEGQDRALVTVGAVIIDTASKECLMFGLMLTRKLVDEWKAEGKIQTIGQAELVPVLITRENFQPLLRHRRVCFFLDNDSARMALIKGCSPSQASNRIVAAVVESEISSQCWSWYGRVPSPSNPGDGPSRLRLKPAAENCYAKNVEVGQPPQSVYAPFKARG